MLAHICRALQVPAADRAVIQPLERPINKTEHFEILRGNLAPGAAAKITGKEGQRFSGPVLRGILYKYMQTYKKSSKMAPKQRD